MEIEQDRQQQFNTLNQKLKQFAEIVAKEVEHIDEGEKYTKTEETDNFINLKKELVVVLQDIAQTGEEKGYEWKYLKSYIIIMLRNVLNEMQATYPDVKSSAGESFEDELEVILQFLCSLETPPFTLQRLCEIINDPKKHYKSSKKILFAIEKLVNVSPIDKSTHVF